MKYNITPFLSTSQLFNIIDKAEDDLELCSMLACFDSYMFSDLHHYVSEYRGDKERATSLEALWRSVRKAWEGRA